MKEQTVRSVVALTLVLGFTITCCAIIIQVAQGALDFTHGTDLIKHFSSVFSGFVGLVIGYYFTSTKETKPVASGKATDSSSSESASSSKASPASA